MAGALVGEMRLAALLVFALIGCSAQQSTLDTGDAQLTDVHLHAEDAAGSAVRDASFGDVLPPDTATSRPDAGTAPCEVNCPDGSQCRGDRCVTTCPCPEDQQCHAPTGQCVPSVCDLDKDCPVSMFCILRRCTPVADACSDDNGCADHQRCTATRQCTAAQCTSFHDCNPTQFCSLGSCQIRSQVDPAIVFERVRLSALEAHRSPLPNYNMDRSMGLHGEWGFGAALLDIDGDLDLDLFLASQAWDPTQSAQACLYRNESVPGRPQFQPVDDHCGWHGQPVHSAFATDINNDGVHELVLGGTRYLALHIFAPQPRVIDLFEQLTDEQRGNGCMVGSLISLDVNYDGLLDLIVGCQSEQDTDDPIDYRKILFTQTPDHDFRFTIPSGWGGDSLLLDQQGNTLALGAADLNNDGLQDLLVSHDALVRESHIDVEPGGIYLRCGPSQNCDFEARPLGPGDRAFGAFMGSGVLHLDNYGPAVYFTDWGANRLVGLSSSNYRSSASEWNAELRSNTESLLYSWGVVIDDFDRDGSDDLFIGQGSVKGGRPYDYRMHYDALLLQRHQRFEIHSDDVGIPPFTTDDSGDQDYVYSSRTILKSDWDYDGFLDLISTSLEGAPRVLRERPLAPALPPRCTLVPRPRYAPAFGTGYRVKAAGQERAWDSQGQLRSSTSPYIVTPSSRGHLRFPSGALIPYDCEQSAGPFMVVEPAWLRLEQDGNSITIHADDVRPDGEISVWVEPTNERLPTEQIHAHRHLIVVPLGTRRLMLRFGQRWLPRWFDVESLP